MKLQDLDQIKEKAFQTKSQKAKHKPEKKQCISKSSEKTVISTKMQEIFSELDKPIDTNKQSLPTPNKPDNKDKQKKGLFKKGR